jgi:putative transcriptional regulator
MSIRTINLLSNHHMNAINRLKVVLVEKQRTSKWLAEQLGKSENTVSRWCSNKIQPSLENLMEIARVLDIDVRMLITPIKDKVI